MKINLLLAGFIFLSSSAFTQAGSEVYLFDLQQDGNSISISNPKNISQHPGYDNQPSFLPDGSAILYTSQQGDQADIMRYELATGNTQRITQTDGSEYSPAVTPDYDFFSTIILEKDGLQLLWRYPIEGGTPHLLIPKLKIGYHCWIDESRLVSFVLGDPPTLQLSDIFAGTNEVLYENIGRSLHRIPGGELISFIHKEKEGKWWIRSYDPKKGKIKKLTQTLAGSEDMAWTSDGTILMGKDDNLFKMKPKQDDFWIKVASLEAWGLKGITRIAVSPTGDKVAIVVAE